jgi:hypothetical protein
MSRRSQAWRRRRRLDVEVYDQTFLRLIAVVEARGLSIEDQVEEAIAAWALKQEQALERDQRTRLERRLSDLVSGRATVEEILDVGRYLEGRGDL